jgi:hypothetical protein
VLYSSSHKGSPKSESTAILPAQQRPPYPPLKKYKENIIYQDNIRTISGPPQISKTQKGYFIIIIIIITFQFLGGHTDKQTRGFAQ